MNPLCPRGGASGAIKWARFDVLHPNANHCWLRSCANFGIGQIAKRFTEMYGIHLNRSGSMRKRVINSAENDVSPDASITTDEHPLAG